jgi:sodium-independent sulfate anion transporter 11
VVLNCAAINNVDITSIQGLIDVRNTLDRYASPETVEWHFSGILNRWTRRSLAISGFGYPAADSPYRLGNWSPVYVVANTPAATASDDQEKCTWTDHVEKADDAMFQSAVVEEERRSERRGAMKLDNKRLESVHGVDRPFFHIDLNEAVDAAVRDAKRKDEGLAE